MLDLNLTGKTALITGGSDGLGKAVAERLAKEGANIAICARRAEHLEQTAAAIRDATGGNVLAVAADVTKAGDCSAFIEAAQKAFGGVDILINNAGTSAAHKLEDLDDDAWQADIDLKLMAAVRLCRGVVPLMRERGGGAIINVTISSAKAPPAGSLPTTVTPVGRDQPDQVAGQSICRRSDSGEHHLSRPDQECSMGAPSGRSTRRRSLS